MLCSFYLFANIHKKKKKKNKKKKKRRRRRRRRRRRKKVFKNQIYFCQDYHFVIVVGVDKEKLLNLDICLYILLDIVMSYFTLSFSHNTFYAIDCCL